jgi:hypothetical protein
VDYLRLFILHHQNLNTAATAAVGPGQGLAGVSSAFVRTQTLSKASSAIIRSRKLISSRRVSPNTDTDDDDGGVGMHGGGAGGGISGDKDGSSDGLENCGVAGSGDDSAAGVADDSAAAIAPAGASGGQHVGFQGARPCHDPRVEQSSIPPDACRRLP